MATDAAGNVYVADTGNSRIQKFSGTGTYLAQWGSPGSGTGQLNSPSGVATDAAGNLYVADTRNHRILATFVAATIALVSDVGNDQGRRVRLRILRSPLDGPGSAEPVLGYDVYLRSDPQPSASSANRSEGFARLGTAVTYLIPATGASEYTVEVSTTVDATAASLEYSGFKVSAVTGPFTSYDSGLEYGFSVDNLAPPVPTPFTAAYLSGATHLHWDVSPASDFATFRLYRGSSADFAPDAGALIASPTDTGYVDVGPGGRYYKLSAKDRNGNEGQFSALGPAQTTDVGGEAPLALALDGVRPNPASGRSLTVGFALPSAARARLELLDIAGRSVAGREVGFLGAGRHVVDLAQGRRVAPGVYWVRLAQGAYQRTTRVAVVE